MENVKRKRRPGHQCHKVSDSPPFNFYHVFSRMFRIIAFFATGDYAGRTNNHLRAVMCAIWITYIKYHTKASY